MFRGLLIGAVAVALTAGALWFARPDEPPARVARTGVSVVTVAHGSTAGSGWVLDADRGLVVTAFHVVNGAATVRVHAGRQGWQTAPVVAAAPCQDIALIALPEPRGLVTVPLGEQRALQSGQNLVTYGYSTDPDSPGWTTIFSAALAARVELGPRLYGRDGPPLRDLVETTGATGNGLSGGPTVDTRGRLIGMTVASHTVPGKQPTSLHVGVDAVRATLTQFKAGVAPGWVGTGLFFRPASARPRGVVVTGVGRGGFTRGGPLVTAVNGKPVGSTFASWCRAVEALPSAPATLTLRRRPGGNTERVVVPVNRSRQR